MGCHVLQYHFQNKTEFCYDKWHLILCFISPYDISIPVCGKRGMLVTGSYWGISEYWINFIFVKTCTFILIISPDYPGHHRADKGAKYHRIS